MTKWQSALPKGNFSLIACWNNFSHCDGGGFRFLVLLGSSLRIRLRRVVALVALSCRERPLSAKRCEGS